MDHFANALFAGSYDSDYLPIKKSRINQAWCLGRDYSFGYLWIKKSRIQAWCLGRDYSFDDVVIKSTTFFKSDGISDDEDDKDDKDDKDDGDDIVTPILIPEVG